MAVSNTNAGGGRDSERARALALRYGWNATAYQIVNPGIEHWFAPDGDAVVGFVRAGLPVRGGRARIVAGAPICDARDLACVVEQFEAEARQAGEACCYLGAAERMMRLVGDNPGYATAVLGAQPVWDPPRWAETVNGSRTVRGQVARARNKGVRVSEWSTSRAESDPGLRRCLNEWLETRPLPPLGFLVEPQTLGHLAGRRVWVAVRGDVPVGFVTCSPIPARRGWLIEQTVRGADAPNGTTEQMIDAAVRALADEGADYVTLGLVPLARSHADDLPTSAENPRWLRLLLNWIRAHGRRFYNFDGLEQFKSKFRPHRWETIHAIVNEPRFRPLMLYAIADSFTGGGGWGLPIALARGMVKAARQEIRWLTQRLRSQTANGYTSSKPNRSDRSPGP